MLLWVTHLFRIVVDGWLYTNIEFMQIHMVDMYVKKHKFTVPFVNNVVFGYLKNIFLLKISF